MTSHFALPIKGNSQSITHFLRDFPIGDMSKVAVFFNDFLAAQDYAAGDWIITTTEAGSGAATETIDAQELGGALKLLNDDADNDSNELQAGNGSAVLEAFALTAGKRLWFAARFKVSDATDSDLLVGLAITDTTLLDGTTDGLYFRKLDAATGLNLVSEKDSVETVLSTGLTMADDAYVEVAFYFDGKNEVTAFKRNTLADQEDKFIKIGVITANIPDNEQLALSLAIQNGEAVAKSMHIDYLFAAQER